MELKATEISLAVTRFRTTRANGEYLSRMFYNDLKKTHGLFSIPDRILHHSKNMKPVENKRTHKAKKSIVHVPLVNWFPL